MLYKNLAGLLRLQIQQGGLRPGERLPSIRQLAASHRVSAATAVQACLQLEREGLAEARPRIGYFVRAASQGLLSTVPPLRSPALISNPALLDLLLVDDSANILPLHAARPAPSLLPDATIAAALSRCLRRQREASLGYAPPQGYAPLRRQIAQRYASMGVTVDADEIIITAGAMEAITLALRVLTHPGDIVLVETPTYQGILQTVATLGLQVLELPRMPGGGLDLGLLETLLAAQAVRAAVMVPNFSNPLGLSLDDSNKRALLACCARHGTVLVEDDIYGDLAWDDSRPPPLRRWNDGSAVITCSSFSKTLSPGLRVGWMLGGGWTGELLRAKYFSTVGNAALPQLAISDYLARHDLERHLRKLRRALAGNASRMRATIAQHWPAGTRLGEPRGGLSLWIQLPAGSDAAVFSRAALAQGVGVMPGHVFSGNGDYRDHVRLSCGLPFDHTTEAALRRLGTLAATLR
ncbi:PLP-dependent aminotransferase family protein [Janthinobacterium sp. RB2R34]|uniref:aminotransferase-like domain-containing protein n=1 Tax=Janthinobacterium sp. RB2R34 TaxID=3424193 RepID=UPI003F285C51